MFKIPGNALVALAILLAAAIGGWLYGHYRDAYRITIDPPNESWLREPPWDLAAQYGDLAPHIQESIFFVTSEAGVLSMRMTIGPLTSGDPKLLAHGFERGLRKGSEATVQRCGTVRIGGDSWSCFAWRQTVDGLATEHRSYLGGRGVSVMIVTFSAVEGRFSILGSPERWMRENVAWDGPSVLYAYF